LEEFRLPSFFRRVRDAIEITSRAQASQIRFDFSAISTNRRSASDRDGASGCFLAHASTFSLSAGESRIGIVSP
jgi:hypothetical protein